MLVWASIAGNECLKPGILESTFSVVEGVLEAPRDTPEELELPGIRSGACAARNPPFRAKTLGAFEV